MKVGEAAAACDVGALVVMDVVEEEDEAEDGEDDGEKENEGK